TKLQAIATRLHARGWVRVAFATAAALLVIAAGGYGALRVAAFRLAPLPLTAATQVSVSVLDRNERLLRAFTTPDGRWRLPVEANDVDRKYLAMLLAFEDRRFWRHGGVDLVAMMRATAQMLRHRRIVSGGSTLTM